MILNKKRGLVLQGSVIYIILIIIFSAIIFAWVSSVGTGAKNYEKVYAKKIALIIDSAKPNTNISVDVSKLYEIADKNNVERLSVVKIDNLLIDPKRYKVFIENKPLDVSISEFKVLYFLASKLDWVYTRNQIIDIVRKDDDIINDRSIDVLIVSLRKKLGSYGSKIKTVRSVGYCFEN